ncbi:MAG: response regulator [Deltaproteobacteria bacterium]|nr:response regulator [Kofleriaceae bacterium]
MSSTRPLEILFVEDDDDHAELVMRSLAEHHVENRIQRVADGQAALDVLAARPPDVVLLDLRLPLVDGLDVLRAIKTDPVLRRIPVVVLTTSQTESDIARAYDLHANAYVVKPIGFSTFVDLMRDLGFFWLAWNRAPQARG